MLLIGHESDEETLPPPAASALPVAGVPPDEPPRTSPSLAPIGVALQAIWKNVNKDTGANNQRMRNLSLAGGILHKHSAWCKPPLGGAKRAIQALPEAARAAIRDVLRVRGYKPSGRGKPASELLHGAACEGGLPAVNGGIC
jgi:hypothetical protein